MKPAKTLFFTIIDRYILREIVVPSFMILAVFTFVLLMGKILQVMDLMVNKGIAFFDIARLTIYLIPGFLVFTVPISLLIAILIGVGRLSGDNEWTVLRMSGLGLVRLSRPIAIVAFAAFLLTLLTTLFLVPKGNLASRSLLFQIARNKAGIGINEKVFIDYFSDILLYADKIPVSGESLEGIFISDSHLGKTPNTIIARRASIIPDPDKNYITLRLEDGSTHTVDENLSTFRKADFHFYDIRLETGSSIGGGKATKSSTEMTFAELKKTAQDGKLKETEIREIMIELNKKLAIPLSCLIFPLLGIPLGMRAHRSVRARGFTIGLSLVLIYYIFRLAGEALAESGQIAPFLGVWTPNIVFALTGALIFFSAAREQSLANLFSSRDKLIKS
jgi:lipopolysaccharide export system permease protein